MHLWFMLLLLFNRRGRGPHLQYSQVARFPVFLEPAQGHECGRLHLGILVINVGSILSGAHAGKRVDFTKDGWIGC